MKYYVGYLVKGEVADYYREITSDLSKRFGIKNLSDTKPPHLTFKAPFETENIEIFEKEIKRVASQYKVSKFFIEGFGRFESMDKTIYLAIKPDSELNKKANGIIKTIAYFGENRKSIPQPFHPHISVARFLDPEMFQKIWNYVSTLPIPRFETVFDGLTLFVDQNNHWEVKSTFPFGIDTEIKYK